MRFIDEKGRLFERVNVIDFAAFILVLIVLFSLIFFGSETIKREKESSIRQQLEKEITSQVNDKLRVKREEIEKLEADSRLIISSWMEGYKQGYNCGYSDAANDKAGNEIQPKGESAGKD